MPVKILCNECQRKIGTVTGEPGNLAYTITAGHGGTASGPSGMFCPDHGQAELSGPKFASALRAAARRKKTVAFSARMRRQ